MSSALALDIETNGKDVRCSSEFRVLGVSYASDKDGYGYLPIGHLGLDEETKTLSMQKLRSLVGRAPCYVFHNGKFDIAGLSRIGLDLWDTVWYDTMLMQHMVDENLLNKSLDYLGKHHFGEGKAQSEDFTRFVDSFGWAFLPVWMIRDYAIQDARLTLRLFKKLLAECKRQGFV